MNTVNKIESFDEEKFNKTKSKSNFHKNYNEKIYFNYDTNDKKKSEIYEAKINEIVKSALSPKYMEIGKEYMDNDENSLNENKSEEVHGGIPSKFLEKLRESTVKVNLNISNNYYNSNYNVYKGKKENIESQFPTQKKEKSESQEKENELVGEETTQNRLTVFIKKIFFGNEPGKNDTNSKNTKNKTSNDFKRNDNEELLYIPCQNCNTMVKIENIDDHSNLCVKVKLEVYQSEIENKDAAVNYKLKKLKENLIKVKSNTNFDTNKESYYIHALIQNLSDCLIIEKNEDENSDKLKKLAINLEFKGSIATQVLLERAKILVKEKLKAQSKSLRSNPNDRDLIKERLTELKRVKEDKVNEAKRLTVQKELLQNKIKSLKSFKIDNVRTRQGTNLKPRNFKFLRGHLTSVTGKESVNDTEECQPRNSGWSNIHNCQNIVDDINSDVENTSQITYNSEASSFYSSNKNDLDNTLNLTIDWKERESHLPRKSVAPKTDTKDMKNLYREFVKLVLKVKFEVFNSNHPGQKISERILFNECSSKGISRDRYKEFIIQELNQPEKYLKCFKSEAQPRMTKFNAKPMAIINEESF